MVRCILADVEPPSKRIAKNFNKPDDWHQACRRSVSFILISFMGPITPQTDRSAIGRSGFAARWGWLGWGEYSCELHLNFRSVGLDIRVSLPYERTENVDLTRAHERRHVFGRLYQKHTTELTRPHSAAGEALHDAARPAHGTTGPRLLPLSPRRKTSRPRNI